MQTQIIGLETFRQQAYDQINSNQGQINTSNNMVANLQGQFQKLESQFAQLSGEDLAYILRMDRIVNKVNGLEIKFAQFDATGSGRVGKGAYNDTIDRKTMMPEQLGIEKGPPWRQWRKEMLAFAETHRQAVTSAMMKVQGHPHPVYADSLQELGIIAEEDNQLRLILVSRC